MDDDSTNRVAKGKACVAQLAQTCQQLSDAEVGAVFDDFHLNMLITSILDTTKSADFSSIAEFFLANKFRSTSVAKLRQVISRSASIAGVKDGHQAYVSPHILQWFDNGVMLLEGPKPFEGFVMLYQNGELKCGVAARSIPAGKELEPADLEFIDLERANRQLQERKTPPPDQLDAPVTGLQHLLDAGETDETKYQELFEQFPWALGLQYSKLQRHQNLDDLNIPDFTGIRVSDSHRDIFELKPPSMKVFRSDGNFGADFNNAWNQAERYLNFARQNEDYLRRKGFDFDNPKCTLICGYELTTSERDIIRIKERMNPAIHLLTYNDVLVFMQETIKFIKRLSGKSSGG